MGLKILTTGSYLPEKIIDNFDLEKIMDTSDEWIQQRTGIVERRVSEKEDTSSLAIKAGQKACQGVDLARIGLVIVASFTPDLSMPNMASKVHKALGLRESCMALDINLACSGFTGSLKLAEGYLTGGDYGLIIGSEVISKHLDKADRSTAVLFGDGAGACLVEKNDQDLYFQHGVIEDEDYLIMYAHSLEGEDSYIRMQGREVYKFAVRQVPKAIQASLDEAGLEADQVDYFILHQANARIIRQIAKNLGVGEEKFPMNLDAYANTSAASIPILLDDMNKSGRLRDGDILAMASFGAGLQYSSLIIEW